MGHLTLALKFPNSWVYYSQILECFKSRITKNTNSVEYFQKNIVIRQKTPKPLIIVTNMLKNGPTPV